MSYQEELLMYEPTEAPWTQSRRLRRAPSLGRAALVGMRFRSLCYAAAVECYTVTPHTTSSLCSTEVYLRVLINPLVKIKYHILMHCNRWCF